MGNNMKPRIRSRELTLMAAIVGWTALAAHADWPMYRADVARSGISSQRVELPLAARWTYQASQAPRPAWPDPVKERHRLDFDHAPQIVVAAKTVFFGSSADDTLRALDAETGRPRWKFTTGGPIRFAPAVDDGRVYVASDDGHLYCLDVATGELFWDFHAAADGNQILGNGRLISRWPLRSGVLVDRGVAYVTAGLWPSEGVMVYALDAKTGKIRWCNDTCDTMYLAQPHAKAYSLTGVSPQGYLLATDELLLVPTGRGVPAAFDRQTGRLRYFKPADSKTHGGSWATISGDRLFNGGLVYDVSTGDQTPCPTTKVPLWAKRDFDFGTRQHVLGYRGDRVLANLDRVIGRRTGHCVAMAGELLLEGGDEVLSAFDVNSKHASTVLWQAKLTGQVRSLAVSDGAIYASTDRGTVHCFGHGANGGTKVHAYSKKSAAATLVQSAFADAVFELLEQSKITKGYAVVIGDADLAESLAVKKQMHVVCLADDKKEVAALRSRFVDSGIYGSRLAVQPLARLSHGDFPPYLANLIVVGTQAELKVDELWRLLRPCGGLLCFKGEAKAVIEQLVKQVEDAPVEQQTTKSLTWLRRGKLPGAFDWDSKPTADQRVKWPLELAWFGGPGPARMQDRHHASVAPPVVANGRYFVPGERHIIAVDAYNGTELWSHPFAEKASDDKAKPVRLAGLAADDESTYYDIGDGWLRLDARTGEVAGSVGSLPEGLQTWGRIAKRELPFATALRTHALTGENVPRIYYRAYGCNQLMVADGVDFFRSGSLGLYDLKDDSGLRNFGGMRPGCWRSHNAAFGVFLSSEGASGCQCTYNFQTSLMLAPSRVRRNEDWAVYHDLPSAGLVRRMNVNLGAPGDRRDNAGRLWLGYPRPSEAIAMQLPISIEGHKSREAAPYHFDSDRRKIHGTNRSWIYASGYRDLKRVTITLDQQQSIVSRRSDTSPRIDGRLSGDTWPDQPQVSLRPVHDRQTRGAPNRRLIDPEKWKQYVRFTHDDNNLYVAFHQPNQLDRRGKPYLWRQKTKGTNAPIWIDDSFELFLSDTERKSVLHFGVSGSGATYDAQCHQEDERESAAWDGKWQAAAAADDKALVVEMAIPWSTLAEAGLSQGQLLVNAQSNWAGWRSPLRFLGSRGRLACENFAPLGLDAVPASPERRFRVGLHFADPGDRDAGIGRFDIQLQGRKVLSGFDLRAEAAAARTAVVKQFEVVGSKTLTIELTPDDSIVDGQAETILSGIELEQIELPTQAK